MWHPIARAAGLATLLCPTVLSVVLPSDHLTPEVPWKRNGLSIRHDNGYPTGCTHGPGSRGCWNGDFDISSDMDLKWPATGKTVKYNFEITNITLAPDGFAKPMMVINGQYPGPTVVADWGDDIEVVVTNHLEINGTGIHWHGLRQLGSNEMDGVGGITECPIAPGETKVYKFKATQYGTSWYHSHYSVQYGDGLVGGIIINGPATADYDIDLGVLPFSDWFHTPLFTVNAASLHAGGPPIADNLLINGSMTSSSGGKYAVTTLTPGKKHLLRLVNMGINNYVHVGLDDHPFTVIAADFVPIVPFTASSLSISVGQRYDVIIDSTQNKTGNYWLRVGTGGRCDGPNANAANIGSIFHYDGAPYGNPNSTGTALPTGCYDETNIVPFVKTQVPQDLPKELTLSFSITAAKNNLVQWHINGSPMLIDFTRPTLQNVIDGNATYNTVENVYPVGEAHKWQYWVIQQDNTTAPLEHPIHLHGHDFYVLDHQANAQWSGDISRLITDNPIRRDTATLPVHGYLVLAFESDNPGAWLMHCHIPFHISAGLGLQFVERQDEIVNSIGDLQGFQDGCKSWSTFQKDSYPDGFELGDSGLRK
ncbi:multicopper oxidase [Melanomma pulvis-pyrius CBS 109.77]|uniref:Multicopper oxidase n=1 Tax=Melanomma pulvis-pyrius CBS 109.77 TaxID=1314802 RepID=A0A6A6XFG0_9PLEO|nr:multicopper oxidase [Melanomma pulvis-pyrius CBS 109.77]